MTMRTLYLISERNASSQRAHFAIWVPSAAQPEKGTLINVIGAPMAGYKLEFKRNYRHTTMRQRYEIFPIGQVHSANIVDSTDDDQRVDSDPKDNLEIAAAQVPPPRISQNIMAPVNDTTNRRCQEWTTDYVRHLVAKGYVGAEAVQIVQSKRDPPAHGIGLLPVGRR